MVAKKIIKRAKPTNVENPKALTMTGLKDLELKLFTVNVEKLPDMVTHPHTLSGTKRNLSPKAARQKQFLQAYSNNGFNITRACEAIGIGRRSFYDWKTDPDFCEDLKIVEDELKDYLKSKLLQLVDAGNLIACIFANKTLGGLVETTRADISVSKGLELSNEHRDKIVEAGLRSMLDRPKYMAMLGLDTEPDPEP